MINIVIVIIKDTMIVMIESIEKIEELDKNQKIENIKGADNISIEDMMIQEREEGADLEDNIKVINVITIIEDTKIITEIDHIKLEKKDRGNKINDA